VELARARHLLLESDGEGHLRACLPAPSLEASTFSDAPPATDPAAAAREAWQAAWPILRHALAGERRRLARVNPDGHADIAVSVYAYRHAPERSRFLLGTTPWTTTVRETTPAADARPFDLAALEAILARGQRIEGGHIEPGGRIRWFTSDPEVKPTILRRPITLADLAVAYRSIAHGGYGEPYMSLERAVVPQVAVVNYGGRLRDTALGMVSLLADVRFKTFSVGVDLLGPGDVRGQVRRSLPGFRTHLERFAADPTAGAILNQQTRLWFRPDDVDLTLSPEQDVCAFRSARMTAVSERVKDAADDPSAAEPPWTKATTAFINAHYDELSSLFPEMADLNETVRWLSVFAWLGSAHAHGVAVPDLDVLMAIELPSMPTPRRFPQLLSCDALPHPGADGVVDVFNRTTIGAALDRLEPVDGRPLPAAVRFRRARAMLDRAVPDQAALAAQMDAAGPEADVVTQDLLSFRAERLLMHARILASLSAEERTAVAARQAADAGTRIFSIGIGGVDLGTNAILARAVGRSSKMGLGPVGAAAPSPLPERAPSGPLVPAAAADPPDLVEVEWPDHGLGPVAGRASVALPDGRGTIVSNRRPGSLVRKGTWKLEDGRSLAWEETVLAMEGPEARARRRVPDPEGKAPVFERLEDGRVLSYRFERSESSMRATPVLARFPEEAFGAALGPAQAPIVIPAGLSVLDIGVGAPSSTPASADRLPPVAVRVRAASGRDLTADVPPALLQRLVLGRDVDASPARPLQAFTPATELLGDTTTLMVMASASSGRPPWEASAVPEPGEVDASRVATALTRWWASDPHSAGARAVVGVESTASLSRWAGAPSSDGRVAIVAPDDAFPGWPAASRAGLAAFPPSSPSAPWIVVVSGEAPGVLGRRLRAIAGDPSNAGKIVAVVALGGAPRDDLPASWLGDGRLAGLGLYEAGPVGIPEAIDAAGAWVRAAVLAKGQRAEAIPGPFTWYY
jgi:hypothetical protein